MEKQRRGAEEQKRLNKHNRVRAHTFVCGDKNTLNAQVGAHGRRWNRRLLISCPKPFCEGRQTGEVDDKSSIVGMSPYIPSFETIESTLIIALA